MKQKSRLNKQALLKLADLLENDAKRKNGVKFDQFTFGKVYDPRKPISCNTVACQLGLAALSGSFKGLSFRLDDPWPAMDFTVRGRRCTPETASRHAFGTTNAEFEYLFCRALPSVTQTGSSAERAAARRLRQFVSEQR